MYRQQRKKPQNWSQPQGLCHIVPVYTVVILSCLRNAIMPKSCFRRLCHSNFVNTLLYITIFCTIPRLHRHRNLPQFLFKQSSASICTTVPKISNKSLLELFFFGTSRENFCPFSQIQPNLGANSRTNQPVR